MFIKLLKIKPLSRINMYPFFILLAFLVWCYAFRNFISGKMLLISDAQAYYEHIKFYIDQLMRGVYPMWDPTVSSGIPNEFYLRRIGSFNTFYLIIIFLRFLGIAHLQAYLLFLALYFFIGMIGFYKLAVCLLRDRRLAFVAYVILMFSSLGTRLFDSFILLTFIPMVWFFYFLVAFAQHQKRYLFLGMTFASMILLTTYIPFYFVTILLSFIFFYGVCFPRNFKKFCVDFLSFIMKYKIFVLVCLVFLFVSILPGALMFQQAKRGEFTLDHRHSTLKTENSIEVDPEWRKWSLMEDVAYANYSSNLKKFNFAVIYIPVFTYVILVLGIIVRLSRKLIFLFFWGGFFFLLGSPEVTGLYKFLLNHVFYFKYFRNLHFFLWIVLLPIAILFLMEQLKNILYLKPRNRLEKILLMLFITILHAGVLVWSIQKGYGILSTYIVLGLSNVFFLFYFSGFILLRRFVFLFLLLLISTTQSMEVFHYLEKNSEKKVFPYRYDKEYMRLRIRENRNDFYMPIDLSKKIISYQHQSNMNSKPSGNYFDAKWTNYLLKNLNREILDSYRTNAVLLFDQVKCSTSSNEIDLDLMGKSWAEFKNLAFIISDKCPNEDASDMADGRPDKYEVIFLDSTKVKLSSLDVNKMVFETDMAKKRFLVFNDSYYDGWNVFINGERKELYRTNVAFKGVWVPSGKNTVEFRFGYWWQYALNYGLLALFYSVFMALIYFWIKDIHYFQSLNRLMHKWVRIGV